MINHEVVHNLAMNEMIKPKGLLKIGELPDLVRVILKEPKFFKEFQEKLKCPDVFINYLNDQWTICELKYTMDYKDKAFIQIESGYELLHDVFNVPYNDIKGKVVSYKKPFEYLDYRPIKHYLINKPSIMNKEEIRKLHKTLDDFTH